MSVLDLEGYGYGDISANMQHISNSISGSKTTVPKLAALQSTAPADHYCNTQLQPKMISGIKSLTGVSNSVPGIFIFIWGDHSEMLRSSYKLQDSLIRMR